MLGLRSKTEIAFAVSATRPHFRDAAIPIEDDHLSFVRRSIASVALIDFGDPVTLASVL